MPRSLGPSDFIAVDAALPCLNPACKEHGASHVGCKCYSPAGGPIARTPEQLNEGQIGPQHFKENFPTTENVKDGKISYAEGGEVHFCSSCMPHHPDCHLYLADGGDVEDNHQFNINPELAVEHAIASHGLHHLLTKTGHSKSKDPHRPIQEFVEHSKKGKNKTGNHVSGMFDKNSPDLDGHDVEGLKKHIDDLHMNPEKILQVGGSLSGAMPLHSGMIAAKAANATSYLSALKPKGNQLAPLDKITPPSKIDEMNYHRQAEIAEQPLSVLNRVKNGTVSPSDIQTLQTLYPAIHQSIMNKTFEKVADAKQSGVLLPHKQRMGLSSLMGPLDFTQTPQASQAIIQSAAGNTASQSQGNQKKQKSGATAATLKQMDKVDEMSQTPLEQIQMNKKA